MTVTSPALTYVTASFPWDRIPKRVRVTKVKQNEFPLDPLCPFPGQEYDAWVSSTGRVAVIIGRNLLGVDPDEFEVIEWWGVTPNVRFK